MPEHYGDYNIRGNHSLMKKHMMPPVETSRKKEPEPITPPPSAEKPPVLDASIDEGNGSSNGGSQTASVDNDMLILIGLGALLLFSYGMVR
tara:strand:+ start:421 stop:693 length:273 start_codon:yes stop_codon:yes gene_type:complete